MKKRNSFSYKEIFEKSKKICDIFFSMDIYGKSEKIFTYVNYKSEFVSSIIIKKALFDGKIVCVPVMSGKKREMFFVEIKSFDDLSKNKQGILEPMLNFSKVLKPDSKTVMVIPALIFDRNGYRLGYGGGFYDQYLSKNKSSFNIGFAFDFQIIDEIVHDEYDIPVDAILSENEYICFKKDKFF